MLVRVNVQSNHQNETHNNSDCEYSDYDYNSLQFTTSTSGPETLYFIYPHAFACVVIVFKLLWYSILYTSIDTLTTVLIVIGMVDVLFIDNLSCFH